MKSKEIFLADLEDVIKKLDDSGGWEREFSSLGDPTVPLRSLETSLLPENIIRDRYDGLGAYDETRVKLKSKELLSSSSSDYINANWVGGQNGKKYIVTQGPLPSTVHHFYQMIWENNVHQVVMLVNDHDIQNEKCAKYYPEFEETFGGIKVTLQKKNSFKDTVVRVYSLEKDDSVRLFVHYHFNSWPDLGVPSDPSQLLSLIKLYKNSELHCSAVPLLIHCSAGVGRTGTLVLTDTIYEFVLNNPKSPVDFMSNLCKLRTERISLCERAEQYALAHRVILKAWEEGHFRTKD